MSPARTACCGLFLCICVCAWEGCGSDADGADGSGTQLVARRGALPGVFTDAQRRRWSCLTKARYEVVDRAPDPAAQPLRPARDLRALSVEALAEELRTVTEIDGYECLSDPDFELARAIRDGVASRRARAEGSQRLGDLGVALTGLRDKAACCGKDERRVYTGDMYQALLLSEIGCTAFFVHPSVAVTAAHCVYNTETDAFLRVEQDGVQRLARWRIAVDGRGGPYVSPSCFRVRVPGGFVTRNAVEHDYALLDFSAYSGGPCPDPEPAPMWLGTWVATNQELAGFTLTSRVGYPREVNLSGGDVDGAGLVGQYTYVGGVVVDGVPWYALRQGTGLRVEGATILHDLDAGAGDSGSPILAYDATAGWYVVAIQKGVRSPFLSSARRWDWTVVRWLEHNSPY